MKSKRIWFYFLIAVLVCKHKHLKYYYIYSSIYDNSLIHGLGCGGRILSRTILTSFFQVLLSCASLRSQYSQARWDIKPPSMFRVHRRVSFQLDGSIGCPKTSKGRLSGIIIIIWLNHNSWIQCKAANLPQATPWCLTASPYLQGKHRWTIISRAFNWALS